MKFLIIVAAYLVECVESIIAQTYNQEDYEILLINDGSTDGRTGQLCDILSQRYSNSFIKVIHKANGGIFC